jgi:peptidoglycan hydrolase CwlO-like protein
MDSLSKETLMVLNTIELKKEILKKNMEIERLKVEIDKLNKELKKSEQSFKFEVLP